MTKRRLTDFHFNQDEITRTAISEHYKRIYGQFLRKKRETDQKLGQGSYLSDVEISCIGIDIDTTFEIE